MMALVFVVVLQGDLSHAEPSLAQRRSTYDLMSRDTRAMQDDDTSNPASLSVLDGEAMWADETVL